MKAAIGLNVMRQSVPRILKQYIGSRYANRTAKPHFTQRHKDARIAFADKKFWEEELQNIISSHEKEFNLDKPAG